ncbi:MAG: hypothetical protein J6J86_09640 [Lachnospiraceae bacterium]|nr:hypothetical protein [Lachnospiraceae bacterium]
MEQDGRGNAVKAFLTNRIEKLKENRRLLIVLILILFIAPYILTPAMESAMQYLKDNTRTRVIIAEETSVSKDVSEDELLEMLEQSMEGIDKEKVKELLEKMLDE